MPIKYMVKPCSICSKVFTVCLTELWKLGILGWRLILKKKSLNLLITVLTNFFTKKEKKKKEKQQSINILITVLTYLPVKA